MSASWHCDVCGESYVGSILAHADKCGIASLRAENAELRQQYAYADEDRDRYLTRTLELEAENAELRKDKAMSTNDRCQWHRPKTLGYVAAHEDAERRMKRGEKQTQCPVCKRWLWKHEMGEKP